MYGFFMTLKLLRFLRMKQATQSLIRLNNILAEIFYNHAHLFSNLLSWTLAATKLILSIHIFACCWIMIYKSKKSSGLNTVTFEDPSIFGIYVSSFYMTTSTITTVGYGHDDYKGFINDSEMWH